MDSPRQASRREGAGQAAGAAFGAPFAAARVAISPRHHSIVVASASSSGVRSNCPKAASNADLSDANGSVHWCLSGTPDELRHLAERIAPIDDPVERLTVAIDSYFDALFHASGAPLVLQALAAAPADARLRTALRRRGDDLRGFSALFARDAVRRGEMPAGTDVDEVAAVTTMLLDGALVAVAEQGDALDRDEVRDRVARSVVAVSGLRPAAR